MKLLPMPTTPLAWLGLMRIMLGLMFLSTWASNLTKGYYSPDGLQHFFTEVFHRLKIRSRFMRALSTLSSCQYGMSLRPFSWWLKDSWAWRCWWVRLRR